MILTIRTDNPEAEIGIFDNGKQTVYKKWQAGRSLSKDINKKINAILTKQNLSYSDLTGIIFYSGPGSYTGLRIGASIANTHAYELNKPIAGASGDSWVEKGHKLLRQNPSNRLVDIEYGSEPKTTKPKK